MKALAIAGTGLRILLLRDRSSVFFVFVMPMMLILILGAAFGRSESPKLGLVVQDGGPLAARMAAELRKVPNFEVETVTGADALVTDVERGRIEAGVIIPEGFDRAVRAGSAGTLRFVARQGLSGLQLGFAVQAAAAREGERLKAARFAAAQRGDAFEGELAAADQAAASVPKVKVEVVAAEGTDTFASAGQFDLGASQELVLFMFLTGMNGSVALITARRLGITRRMLATPTPVRAILAGEALGRIVLSLLQGALIMVGSALLFGVDWGSPVGAVSLLLAFCLVAGGAAMLTGTLFRTEQQAGAAGIFLSLSLAALGGSMMPLEFFSPTMRAFALLTPHAWANDGFGTLILHGGGFVDILPNLGVLLAYAAALFALGAWLLRRSLTAGVS